MAINYTALAATAERLIRENGRDVTFKRRNKTPADATKPWKGAGAPSGDTDHTVKGVLVPYTEDEMKDEQLRRGSMKAYVASNEITQQDDFEFLSDAVTGEWRVVTVQPIQPGPVCVLFEVAMRR